MLHVKRADALVMILLLSLPFFTEVRGQGPIFNEAEAFPTTGRCYCYALAVADLDVDGHDVRFSRFTLLHTA